MQAIYFKERKNAGFSLNPLPPWPKIITIQNVGPYKIGPNLRFKQGLNIPKGKPLDYF